MQILLCGMVLTAVATAANAQSTHQPQAAPESRIVESSRTPVDHSLGAAQGFGNDSRWFCPPGLFQLEAGPFCLNSMKFNTLFPGVHRFNTRHGWGISSDILFNIPRIQQLAVGLTVGYYAAHLRSLTTPFGGSFAADGTFYMIPLMLTMIYEQKVLDRLTFFAGVSAGLMYHNFEIRAPLAGLNYDKQSQWNFGAGVRAGVRIRLLQSLSLIATYQFLKGFGGNGGVDGNAVMFGFSVPWG